MLLSAETFVALAIVALGLLLYAYAIPGATSCAREGLAQTGIKPRTGVPPMP
jgi:hypothetical protein